MRALTIVSLVVIAAVTACNKGAATPIDRAPPVAHDAAPVDVAPPPIAPRVPGALGDVLDGYDSMRLQLAHDDAAAAKKSAEQISKSAGAAGEAANANKTGPLSPGTPGYMALNDIVITANKMAKAGDDIALVRAAFADVSKDVVALLVADPSLQTGRFLFLCPMTKGYQKWVQTTAKLENPFFGKAMLDCGEQLKSWSV